MPANPPPTADSLAAQLAAAYILAEQNLLAGVTSILRRTRADMFGQLQALQLLRRLVARILPGLASMDAVAVAMVEAAAGEGVRGADAAVSRELAVIGAGHGGGRGTPPTSRALGLPEEPFDLSMPHGVRAAQAIRDDITSELLDVRRRITRLPDDIYKAIAPHGAIYQVLPNPVTAAQAQAMAWRVFASQGVTGFVDRSGREWSMSAYTEMAVRTAAARAYNDSHLQRFRAIGVDYFSVPEHENTCPLCFPWQHKILTDGPNPNPDVHTDGTLAEAIAAGLFHPNCFPGFVPVSAPTGVSAADSRWYEGELVVIHTAAGNELSVTPNHPVLTPEGWVTAGDLAVGDRVVRDGSQIERVDDMRPDDEHVEACIGDVYDALRHARGVTTVSVPSSAEQFHGDGSDADVEVVLVDRFLADGRESSFGEKSGDRSLFVGGVRFAPLLAESTTDQFIVSALRPTHSVVSGGREDEPLCLRHVPHAAAHRLAEVGSHISTEEPPADGRLRDTEVLADLSLGRTRRAHPDGISDASTGTRALGRRERLGRLRGAEHASISDELRDPRFTDANGGRDLAARLTRDIPADEVVAVERRQFAGHVYNLQTGGAWYVAGSIVVHNCRHTLIPFFPGRTQLSAPPEWTDELAQRYRDSQRQRAIERDIRTAKRRLEYAADADTAALARKEIRQAQARMRLFLAGKGTLPRQSRREQLDLTDPRIKLPSLR